MIINSIGHRRQLRKIWTKMELLCDGPVGNCYFILYKYIIYIMQHLNINIFMTYAIFHAYTKVDPNTLINWFEWHILHLTEM